MLKWCNLLSNINCDLIIDIEAVHLNDGFSSRSIELKAAEDASLKPWMTKHFQRK